MTSGLELVDQLLAFARRTPAAPAVVDARVSFTFGDLAKQAAALAGLLAGQGVEPGGRVGYLGDGRAEAVVTLLATWSLGATAVLIDPASGAAAIAGALQAFPPELLVQPAGVAPRFGRTLQLRLPLERAGSAGRRPPALSASDKAPGAVVFTSGSTGHPKGVLVSRRALAASAAAVSGYLSLEPSDAGALLVPMATRMGLSSTLAHLASGSALLLEAGVLGGGGGFQNRHAAGAATSIICVPTQLRVLLDRGLLAAAAFPRLRAVRVGAGALSSRDVDRLSAACPGAELLLTYGTSETGEISIARGEDLALPGCVGRPLPDVALTLLDAAGQPRRGGERGEIAVASPRVMSRYHDAPADLVGAHRTGDVGRLVGGRLFLEGREREIVKSGGETVSPLAVERVLREQPGVAEAAVIGVPDPLLGEAPVAFVVARSGEAAPEPGTLRAACAVQLSRLSVPRRIVFLDAIPRLPSGKPDRPALLILASGRGPTA